jgi:hypothetical protein
MKGGLERLSENPFHVLGLRPDCTPMEVEREGRRLLGMLELGFAEAESYETPVGPRARTPEKVRLAMAELMDPDKRVVHEIWASLTPRPPKAPSDPAETPWPDALFALGWRAR